jgi:hypothetical protein
VKSSVSGRYIGVQYLKFSREIQLLLVNHSNEKEELLYNNNPYAYQISKLGARPPYYTNPRYEQYYPII